MERNRVRDEVAIAYLVGNDRPHSFQIVIDGRLAEIDIVLMPHI
jgi:hypothetical protein